MEMSIVHVMATLLISYSWGRCIQSLLYITDHHHENFDKEDLELRVKVKYLKSYHTFLCVDHRLNVA